RTRPPPPPPPLPPDPPLLLPPPGEPLSAPHAAMPRTPAPTAPAWTIRRKCLRFNSCVTPAPLPWKLAIVRFRSDRIRSIADRRSRRQASDCPGYSRADGAQRRREIRRAGSAQTRDPI